MTISASAFTGGVAVAFLLISGAACAEGESSFGPQTYAVQEFDVAHFVGTLEIVVEARSDIEISATGPSDPMSHLLVNASGSSVELTYDNPQEQRDAWSNWHTSWAFWRRDDNEARLAEFPIVVVRMPEGTPVDVDGITGRLSAGNLNGAFTLDVDGSLQAEIGNVASADIAASGSGVIRLGDIAGDLNFRASGSGDFAAGTSRAAMVQVNGSSDVHLGTIATGLQVSSSGSGSLEAASINGAAMVELRGSGDVSIDGGRAPTLEVAIFGSASFSFDGTAADAKINIIGSGDARLARVEGPVEIGSAGSGDVRIDEGRADGFVVRSAGSGDVYFGGTAVDAEISSLGSGSVTVEDYQGRYQNSSNN